MSDQNLKVGVEVTGTNTTAKAAMREVGVEAEAMQAKVTASTDKASGGMLGMAEKFKQGAGKQIEALTGVIAKVTAAIGIFYTFLELGKKIGEMLESNASKVRDFTDSLTDIDNNVRLDKTQKQIDDLQAKLSQALHNSDPSALFRDWQEDLGVEAPEWLNDIAGKASKVSPFLLAWAEYNKMSAESLKAQSAELEKIRKTQLDFKNAQDAKKEKAAEEARAKANADTLDKLRQRLADARIANLEGDKKIIAQAAEHQKALDKEIATARTNADKTEAEKQVAAIKAIKDEVARQDRKSLDDYYKEANKKEDELQKKKLDNIAQQREALRSYQKELAGGFGFSPGDRSSDYLSQILSELQTSNRRASRERV